MSQSVESGSPATGDARRWALYGAAFGVCFPVLALSIRVAQSGLRGAVGQFVGDPLLWIIATAPLFLGAFAWLGGRQHERVRAMSANLERLVERRTAALSRALAQVKLVTDSVGDGLITVTLDGVVEHASAAAVRVFGAPDGRPASAYLLGDGGAAQMFDLGLEQLREDLLPAEILLDQLRARVERDGRTLELTARPCACDEPDGVGRLLLVARDISSELEAERARAESQELQRVLSAIASDAGGFRRFAEETEALLEQLRGDRVDDLTRRALHTLKGNAAIFGLERLSTVCHEAETVLAEDPARVPEFQTRIAETWSASQKSVERVVPRRRADERTVRAEDLRALERLARRGADGLSLFTTVRRLAAVPLTPSLERLAAHVRLLSERLGREVDVTLDVGDVRFDEERLHDVVSSLVHAVRNAVHHGIESPEEREAAGKAPRGRLTLRAEERGDRLVITVEDDGRGVSWARVRQAAARRGVTVPEGATLLDVLCIDGFTTAAEVSDVSGRGVGLAAVRGAARAVRGEVTLETREGEGTVLRVDVPLHPSESMLPRAA